eukprot:scaffold1819_cov160-Amphora_coffeaeformis.AAC.2
MKRKQKKKQGQSKPTRATELNKKPPKYYIQFMEEVRKMPLASSRSASLKRAQALDAEKKERKRMRKSLPSTIPSAFTVDEAKCRRSIARRQSFSSKCESDNNENDEPNALRQGPTPYWKVVQDRGGAISPPQTRSAKKNKLPPRHDAPRNGVMLAFSPPDQKLNEQREKGEAEAKAAARAKRIQKNRDRGSLLVFSPSNRPGANAMPNSTDSYEADDVKNGSFEGNESETFSDLSSSAGQSAANTNAHTEQLSNEVRSLREAVSEIVQSKRSTAEMEQSQQSTLLELAAEKAKNETLQSLSAKLEGKIEGLQGEIREIQSKRISEKEERATEKFRRESEMNVIRKDLQAKVTMLDDMKSTYESQLLVATEEKNSYVKQKEELQAEIEKLKEELQYTKEQLKKLNAEYEITKEAMNSEQGKFMDENTKLREKSDVLEKANKELQKSIDEYLERIGHFEVVVIPEKDQLIVNATRHIEEHKAHMEKLQGSLNDLQEKLGNVEQERDHIQSEYDGVQAEMEDANEQFVSEVNDLKAQISEKEAKLGELFQQLGEARLSLENEQTLSTKMQSDFEKERSNYESQLQELGEAMSDAMQQLEAADQNRADLEDKIRVLEEQLKVETGNQAAIQQKNSTVSESLARAHEAEKHLRGQNQEKQNRIVELERALVLKEAENKDLRDHVKEQLPREQALYQRLQTSDEIRRQLHARVMQLMGNIRVFVRVRPVLEDEKASSLIRFPGHTGKSNNEGASQVSSADDLTKKVVEVVEPKKDRGGLSDRRKKWKFGFDEVFDPATSQHEVWNATEPLIQSAIDGFNVTIFAYGQTGSGKSKYSCCAVVFVSNYRPLTLSLPAAYTLLGDGVTCRGVIGRSIAKLFDTKHEIESTSEGRSRVELSVEMLEVYNEEVRDLLATNFGSDGKLLNLKVNSQEVVGNEIVAVNKEQDILGILTSAQKRRCVKATASNAASSRSHLLFTLNITVELESGVKRVGKLNICDLAGSERLDKSGTNIVGGSLLQESKSINKSLSVLSHVIEKLQAGSPSVPFRESKLTFLLRNSLIGNSKTLAIVCCSPIESHHHETLCSLRFAEKVNKVELNKAVANGIMLIVMPHTKVGRVGFSDVFCKSLGAAGHVPAHYCRKKLISTRRESKNDDTHCHRELNEYGTSTKRRKKHRNQEMFFGIRRSWNANRGHSYYMKVHMMRTSRKYFSNLPRPKITLWFTEYNFLAGSMYLTACRNTYLSDVFVICAR